MTRSNTFRSLFAEPGDGVVDLHGFFSDKSEPAYISWSVLLTTAMTQGGEKKATRHYPTTSAARIAVRFADSLLEKQIYNTLSRSDYP